MLSFSALKSSNDTIKVNFKWEKQSEGRLQSSEASVKVIPDNLVQLLELRVKRLVEDYPTSFSIEMHFSQGSKIFTDLKELKEYINQLSKEQAENTKPSGSAAKPA